MLSTWILRRAFHCTPLNFTSKSTLAELRKKTGYTFANCKKALELHENNLQSAEKWLHEQAQKEGWIKATKLKARPTTQGLIAVSVNKNYATILEVNCETDFVARNASFHEFVGQASTCLTSYISQLHYGHDLTCNKFSKEQLENLPFKKSQILSDFVALTVGQLGENISLKRAAAYSTSKLTICGYTHPCNKISVPEFGVVSVGNHGAIAAFQSDLNDMTQEIENSIIRHIVGMKPTSIGDLEDFKKKKAEPSEVKTDSDDEKVLLYQQLLQDEETLVGDYLLSSGVNIIDFVRFSCGDNTTEEIDTVIAE